jgi:outer membrane lipoprotein-sorting protein
MLKESMMGSDLSYEDTVGNETLSSRYTPAIAGEEAISGRDCWLLELAAKSKAESYPKRRLWIDKETGDCVRYELFALSGAKLKEYSMLKAETFGDRRFPVEVEIRDLLRKNSKTTMKMRNVEIDVAIPDSVFSQRNLAR